MFSKISSWGKYLILGLGFFVFFLIYYFPAQLAWSLLPKQRVDLVGLYGLNGPWHCGVAAFGQVLGVPVRDITWQLRPTLFSPLRWEIHFSFGDTNALQGQGKANGQRPRKVSEFPGFPALQLVNLGLGDFQGKLSYSSKGLELLFRDRGGPLAVSGVFLLQLDRKYNFFAALTPREPKNRDLAVALSFLGPPGHDGSVRVSTSGTVY